MSLPKSGLQVEATGTQAYIGDLSKAASATDKFTRGLSDAAKSSGSFAEVVTGGLRRVGEVAVNALADAGRAVAGFLKDSVQTAGDVEQTLNVLAVTSGATADEMAKISDKAIALGGDLELPATSAQDAAQAMLELSKAGFTAQESMDAAKGVLQLAAAAEVDAGTAAQIAAGAINAFGLEAADSARVADLLAGAANASSASMTDLSDGLKQGGFAFDAAGQSIEDLTTSLAALTNVGLTGSDAGTALKNAMMRLMNPTDKAAGLMKKLGINAYDAQGNMKPWPAVLDNIRKATAGMTQEQRNAALGTIFLSDGMKALIPLLDLSAQEYEDLKAKVTATGSAQEVAGAQTQGFNGALAGLQSQMETVQLIIGTKLLPLLTPLIQQFAASAGKVGEFISTFSNLAPEIGKSSNPLNTFFNILRIATDDAWNPAIAKAQEFLVALAPVGAFIWDTLIPAVGEAFLWLGDKLPGAISTVVTWLETNLPPAIQAASEFWQSTLQPALAEFGGFLTGTVIPALTDLADWLKVKIPEAVNAATTVWKDVLQPALTTFSAFMTETVIPKLVELNTWLLTNIPGAAQKTTDAWTITIQPAFTALNDYVVGEVIPTFTTLNDLLLNKFPESSDASAEEIRGNLHPALAMLTDYIGSQVLPIIQDLTTLGVVYWTEKLQETQRVLDEGVYPALKNIADFITGTALGVWDALTKASQTQNPVLNDLATAFGNIAKWVDDCTSAVRKFIDAAAKIKVPSLVTPGSPTPLEMGLRGIAAGASEATDAMKGLFATGPVASLGPSESTTGSGASAPVEKVLTAAEIYQRTVNQLVASLGGTITSAQMLAAGFTEGQMTSPVAAPGVTSSTGPITNTRSNVYAPVYGQSVRPNPTVDSAIARSMAQW
jgi:TP901 family phage tail tape measure protein